MPSRRVLINEGELEALKWALKTAEDTALLLKETKVHARKLRTLLNKVDKAEARAAAKSTLGPLLMNPSDIDALGKKYAPRKFAPLEADGIRGRVIELLRQHGVTKQDWERVMTWLARQNWRGSTTALDVLNNWPQWSAKAKAEAAAPTGGPALLEDN